MLTYACLLTAALTAVPSVAAPDEIFRIGSTRPIRGSVVSENALVVKYKPEGISQTQEISSAKVARIQYDDAPDAFKKAMDFFDQGDFDNAASNFKLLEAAKTRGDWAKVYGQFYTAESNFRLGAKNTAAYRNAADGYEKLLKDHPDNRFLPISLQHWGEALSYAKDPDGAATVFDRLGSEAKEKKLGLLWEARAIALKAESYDRNGVPDKAKDAYAKAGSFAAANAATQEDDATRLELESIAGKARLSEGVTLLKNQKYSDARRAFEQIAQDTKSTEAMVAGAQAGIGEVHFAEGRFREALTQFARVRVKHFLVRDETARATYFLGLCCLELGDAEPNGKRKAREYFTEVVERYSDTSWANQAQAKL